MADKRESEGHEDNGTNGVSYPQRYVVTAAQASYRLKYDRDLHKYVPTATGSVAEMHENLVRGFDRYCKDNGAELIILEMAGKDAGETIMHESVASRDELFSGNRKLNSNIRIRDIVVPPQNVDPTTGKLRLAQRDTTLVYAHTKQRFRAVPSSNSKLPRLLITTGAVTTPNYNRSNHRGDMAFRDHTYGAAVVEVIDNSCYNVRFLRAQGDGKFVDFGFKYDGDRKPKKCGVEALVPGDIHAVDVDPDTMAATFEMIDFLDPKMVILHDLFDGRSINPFEKDNLISKARDFERGRLSLEEELKTTYQVLRDFAREVGKRKKVYVVASNHPYFIDRYLESGDYLKDPWNFRIASYLASKKLDGVDPLKAGLERMGTIPSNVTFLGLRDDLKVWGYQLASHGHKGLSGSKKSSATSREIAHGKSITGHTHTPEILRDTCIVGTSSRLDMEYTDGSASSWMAANAVLYEGGTIQLIPIIRGKWKAKE
jgi:hypothetical protein